MAIKTEKENSPDWNVLLSGMVDTIFADVAQPDQARIVAINAHHFLRNEGHVVISIKVCYVAEGSAVTLIPRLHNICLELKFLKFSLASSVCGI